jgi:hypothetical protein
MTSVMEVLRESGYGDLDEQQVATALRAVLPPRAHVERTAADDEFLRAHAGLDLGPDAVTEAGAWHVAQQLAEHARTMDTAAVAAELGVDRTRVQHLRATGDLFAYKVGRANRYPTWQLTSDLRRPLPALRRILAALGPGVHHSVVTGFMTTPQPELVADGTARTPAEWLAAGADPAPVVALAAAASAPW